MTIIHTFAYMSKIYISAAVMAFCLLLPPNLTVAQTSLERDDRHTATLISPYYFGPNAFPVPDMNDGTVSDELRIEVDGDCQPGDRGDITRDIFIRTCIPLFSDRVCLSLWMTAVEWYRNSERSMEECRLVPASGTYDIESGRQVGDLYISSDILLLREGTRCPSIALRSVLKTASDDGWHLGRYYDSPGYFFDATAGKSFAIGEWYNRTSLRIAAQGGFLCWQTDNGRQNDAVMYGLLARLDIKRFFISASWCGYRGWENTVGNGGEMAKDRPMVLRSGIGYRHGSLEFDASYQYGVRDFPYQRIRAGVIWHYPAFLQNIVKP